MRKVFSVEDNCVDPEFMIQGSSEPLKHLSYGTKTEMTE